MTKQPTVFLSYAHDDEKWATAIAEALQAAGSDVWYDTNILPGERWEEQLRAAIDGASTVLVIVSANAAASHWMQFEIGAAVAAAEQEDKRVIPIYLSKRGEGYLPLLSQMEGINVAGLRPKEAGRRVSRLVGAPADAT